MSYPAPEVSGHVASGTSHGVTIKLVAFVKLMIFTFTSSVNTVASANYFSLVNKNMVTF